MSTKGILDKHAEELAAVTSLRVDVVEQSDRLFVIIHDYYLPNRLSKVEKTDVFFITDFQYPFSAMDMFWTDVDVVRPDGSLFEGSEVIEDYIGRKWRRFSYHRNGVWNPAGNPLFDHFAFMEGRWTGKAKR